MRRWTIKRAPLLLLGCVTFIMLLIVVLPFVDLPDTAFHRGTAPVLVHAQGTSAPAAVASVTVLPAPVADRSFLGFHQAQVVGVLALSDSLPILFHSLRR